jgi:molybdate transport system ATP-binding protein
MLISVRVEHVFRGFSLGAAFDAPRNGITVLFGPSGCGKTTILKAMAGLFRPDRVSIDFAGERLQRVPPERRRFGMVFQEGRLFPHLTVRDNLLYGLRRAPRIATRGGARQIYVDETVALLGLEALLKRYPAHLSGGERQRVAIGRALLSQPRLLLMDEPLASLDAGLRQEILPYLMRLRETLRLPMIYVTHAMEEVVRLADHLVLLEAGRVVAQGTLSELASRVDLPLAARDDAAGVLSGYVHSHDPARRLSAVACGGLVFLVPRQDIAPQTAVRLRVPAREVIIALDAPHGISVNNIVPAVVCGIGRDEAAHAALVELDVGGGQLLSRITMDAAERLQLRPGMRVLALVKSMSVEMLA